MFGLLSQQDDQSYGGLLDPRAAQYASLAAGLSQLGAALAPTTDISGRARGMAMVAPAMQQAQQGVMQQGVMRMQGQRAAAYQRALQSLPEDQRGIYAGMSPDAGAAAILQQQKEQRQRDELRGLLGQFGLVAPPATNAPQTAPVPQVQSAPLPPVDGANLPRGLRNNNPLNIEAGNFTQGLPGFQGSDGRFARFETQDQGIAAADKLLQSYAARGLNTPVAIIGRWAPSSDGNNVNAYAAKVAERLGVRPDQQIDMADPNIRRQLIGAMAEVENGRPLAMPTAGPAPAPGAAPAPGGGVPANAAMGLMLGGALAGNPTMMQLGTGLAQLQRQENRSPFTLSPGAVAYDPVTRQPVAAVPREPSDSERNWNRFRELANMTSRTPAQEIEFNTLAGGLGQRSTIDRSQNSFDTERGKEIAGVVTGIERAGRGAPNQLMRLGQIERDLERVTTGVGANASITLGQLAQRLGVPDSALPSGFDRAATASAENIRSISMSLIQATLASGEFPSQNFSNADLQTLQQANPGLFNSPEGNRAIIAVQRAMAERNAEIAREWTAWKRANGSGMESASRFLDERMPEIANRDVLAPILKDFRGQPAQAQNPPDMQRPPPAASSLAVPLGNSGMSASPPPAAGGWSIRPVR